MCAKCPRKPVDLWDAVARQTAETIIEYHARMNKKHPHPIDESHRIRGTGSVPADGMLVGEAGGVQEHFACRPFVGKTGLVMDAYLRAAGVARPDIFITNTLPFWTGPGNPDPSSAQIKKYERFLVEDLRRVRPRVIGAVGRVALNWFFPGEGLTLDEVHGVPLPCDRVPGATVIGIYHPASGFYAPELASRSQEDFFLFAHYLRSPVKLRKVPKIKVVYHEEAPEWIEDAAVDTEGLEDKPWGLSWAYFDSPNVAHVWVCGAGKRPPKLRGRIKFHHALHDLAILRAMGIDTSEIDPDDSMVRAFVLQLEPQGLKALSFRHLGLRMTTFDETTRPWFTRAALTYLMQAGTLHYPKPKPRVVDDYSKKRSRIYSPWSAGRRVNSILTSYAKTMEDADAEPTKLEKRWADLPEEFQAQIEGKVGAEFPKFSIFCVSHEQAVEYSGTDASATCLVDPVLEEMIEAKSLKPVYEMDRRALKFIDRCQEVGMRVNLEKLGRLEEELDGHRAKAARVIRRIVGDRWFNPGSGDQVASWLYTVRGLPVDDRNRTEGGRGSTSDGALQLLKGYHAEDPEVRAFIQATQDYREADKYLGTFVERIFAAVRRDRRGDWRLHPSFKVTRVVSGRVSETMVMMVPSRTALGRKIREAFEAADGFELVDADLSQIELRIGAHLSGDRTMKDAFERKLDLHSLTGAKFFRCLAAVVSETQRYTAKIINFATFYGITARALLEQLYKADIFSFTLEDCERFIREWFEIFSAVRGWQRSVWKQAEKDGFVRDMWGRICYVPNLRVMDGPLQEAAQRLSTNFPVQSGVSGFIKKAEIRIDEWIDRRGLREDVRPWLQMHDELLLEVRLEMAAEVKRKLERIMTADQERLSVPIVAKAGIGRSWAAAKAAA